MDRLHEYAWGATTLGYLYRHLGLASKAKVKQMAGYLTLLEMIWSPYTPSVRETYPFDPVTLFHGCISAGDIVEPYLPERVLRQFGYVQIIPPMPIRFGLKRTNRVSQSQQNLLITLAQHFGLWDVHTLTDDRLGTPIYCSWDSSPDYMEWFVSHSHPRVQNPAQRVIGDSTSIPTINVQPYEAIANARSLMEPLLSRWRSGD
ncbi:hypothetical protein ACS0TY_010780 [Phlomoides rotata]